MRLLIKQMIFNGMKEIVQEILLMTIRNNITSYFCDSRTEFQCEYQNQAHPTDPISLPVLSHSFALNLAHACYLAKCLFHNQKNCFFYLMYYAPLHLAFFGVKVGKC